MAGCIPMHLNNVKFNAVQLDRFSDRIENVLEDVECREIFKKYVERLAKEYRKSISLWEEADYFMKIRQPFDEDMLLELVDEIDDFNENKLFSASEPLEKLHVMKCEAARILSKLLKPFIGHLRQHHS